MSDMYLLPKLCCVKSDAGCAGKNGKGTVILLFVPAFPQAFGALLVMIWCQAFSSDHSKSRL